jgi:hypothetical protein
MSRIKDLQAEALIPAADDFAVIDGQTSGPRKIRLGSAAVKTAPTSGNASAGQVVLGDDSRLAAGAALTSVVVSNVQDGDLLQFDNSTATWRNSQKSLLTDGGNY